jgi:hypothetical protein
MSKLGAVALGTMTLNIMPHSAEKPNLKARLSTVHLLFKVSWFVKSKIVFA